MAGSPAYGARSESMVMLRRCSPRRPRYESREPPVSAARKHLRKINHNPLELVRVSAGVTSCDVRAPAGMRECLRGRFHIRTRAAIAHMLRMGRSITACADPDPRATL